MLVKREFCQFLLYNYIYKKYNKKKIISISFLKNSNVNRIIYDNLANEIKKLNFENWINGIMSLDRRSVLWLWRWW